MCLNWACYQSYHFPSGICGIWGRAAWKCQQLLMRRGNTEIKVNSAIFIYSAFMLFHVIPWPTHVCAFIGTSRYSKAFFEPLHSLEYSLSCWSKICCRGCHLHAFCQWLQNLVQLLRLLTLKETLNIKKKNKQRKNFKGKKLWKTFRYLQLATRDVVLLEYSKITYNI